MIKLGRLISILIGSEWSICHLYLIHLPHLAGTWHAMSHTCVWVAYIASTRNPFPFILHTPKPYPGKGVCNINGNQGCYNITLVATLLYKPCFSTGSVHFGKPSQAAASRFPSDLPAKSLQFHLRSGYIPAKKTCYRAFLWNCRSVL